MFASSIAKVKNATRFPKTLRGFGYDINDGMLNLFYDCFLIIIINFYFYLQKVN